MAHISSLGAGMFSDLSFTKQKTETVPADGTAWMALFDTEIANGATGTTGFVRIPDVREFPAMGTPPNIVNVPGYGSKTSFQIQGQADAPTMELQINFKAVDWQDATDYLGKMLKDGLVRAFRFSLLNVEPTGSGATKYASVTTGLGAVENSQWFWLGKLEALLVSPQLNDSNTATLTLTVQSEIMGAYTSAGA